MMACRLCLNVLDESAEYSLICTENSFSDDYYLILKILPHFDVSLSCKPLICISCSATLHGLDAFKDACIDTENKICEYKNTFITDRLDMKKVVAYFQDVKITENNVDLHVCRICFSFIEKNEPISLVQNSPHMKYFQQCMPEMVIEDKSKLCQNCATSSEQMYNFHQICLSTESLLKEKYAENSNKQIDEEEFITIAKNKSQEKINFTKVMVKEEPIDDQKDEKIIDETSIAVSVNKNEDISSFTNVIVKEEPVDNLLQENIFSDVKIKAENEDEFNLEDDSYMVFSNEILRTQKKFFCFTCLLGYKRKHNLIIHIKNHHNFNIVVPLYHCPDCDFEALRKNAVKRHIERHHAVNTVLYSCHICKYTTYIESNLKQHIYCRHKKDKKSKVYYCTYCDFNTYYSESWKKHMRVQHIKTDSHKCKLCGFETFYKNHLNTHIVTKHQQTTLHKCEFCDYTTYSKVAFQSHVKFKHLKPENELRVCETCKFETRCRKSFSDHMRRLHWKSLKKIFSCDLCKYQTGLKASLTEHKERVHPELCEVLKCPVCEYKTTVKKDFYKHRRVRHKITQAIANMKKDPEQKGDEEKTQGKVKVKIERVEVKQEIKTEPS